MPSLALACRLSAVSRASRRPFSPASLFSSGEQGVWYDPSDLSTMYQDAAGTTPVTAMEQPVGLILDKSKGLVLGPELVSNGDFSNGTTGWVKGDDNSSIAVVDGKLVCDCGATTNIFVKQTIATVAGRAYFVSVDVVALSSHFAIRNGGTLGIGEGYTTTLGTRKTWFVATGSTIVLTLVANDARRTATVDNISVRELPGNHAYQSTSASRPVLSARVNQYLNTATLATQNVTTLATTYTLRFEGTGSITLSGTATGTYTAGAHSVVCTAGTLTSTVTGTVTNADLRPTNSGVNLPPYQRVNTSTDYDTAGFPHYLKFDGIDDSLVTNSIDFTGTDKMTVFAGFRKLSSITQSIVGNRDIDADGPSFGLWADVASSNVVRAFSGGAFSNKNLTSVSATGFPAPLTLVSTFTGDIAADINRIRINGVLAAETFSDQGSGNHANLPLVIGTNPTLAGRRFNGHIYSLIVRGAQSSEAQILSAETYCNQKTGAY